MKQWMSYAIACAALTLAHHSALAGVPAWCQNVPSSVSADPSELSSTDPTTIVKAFVGIECKPNVEVDANRAQIEEARAAWGKKLGLNEADWADAVEWSALKPYDELEVKGNLSSNDVTKYTPIDQYLLIGQKTGAYGKHPVGEMYGADLFEPSLTETGRLAFLEVCVRTNNEVLSAACQADIDAFDITKLFNEVRSDTQHDGNARMAARLLAVQVASELKAHADAVAKIKKSDDGYAKMFEIAAQTRTHWMAAVGSNAKLLAIVNRLESATFEQSSSLFANCGEPSYAALVEAAAKLNPTRVAGMKDERADLTGGFVEKALPVLLDEPAFYNAAMAVALCGDRPGLSGALGKYVDRNRGSRGPREMAINEIAAANLVLDRRDNRIIWPQIGAQPLSDPNNRHGDSSGRSFGGEVKSVKNKGDHLEIELVPVLVADTECVREHVTNKIDRIENDGRVAYQIQCDAEAKVTRNVGSGLLELSVRYDKIVKPGYVISILPAQNGKDSDLIAMWSNAKATKPMWLFGANVK